MNFISHTDFAGFLNQFLQDKAAKSSANDMGFYTLINQNFRVETRFISDPKSFFRDHCLKLDEQQTLKTSTKL